MPPNRPDLQEKFDSLVAELKAEYRARSYRIMLDTTDFRQASDWALLTVGASFPLLISNAHYCLAAYDAADVKKALWFLLTSGVCGFIAKYCNRIIHFRADSIDPMGTKNIDDCLNRIREVQECAAKEGMELKIDEKEVVRSLLQPIKEQNSWMAAQVTWRLLTQHKDPDAVWRRKMKYFDAHNGFVGVQIVTLIIAAVIFICSLRAEGANQTVQPTKSVAPQISDTTNAKSPPF